MERVNITLNLPESLVERARSAGLLSDAQIERWLTEELDRQAKLDNFFSKLDRLAELEPPLTEEEINAEIEQHRREKNQRRQGDSS